MFQMTDMTIREMTAIDRLIKPSNYDLFGVEGGEMLTECGDVVRVESFYDACVDMKEHYANEVEWITGTPSYQNKTEKIERLATIAIRFYFLHEVVAGRSDLGLVFPIDQLYDSVKALTSDDFADFIVSHDKINPFEYNPVANMKLNKLADLYRTHFHVRSSHV